MNVHNNARLMPAGRLLLMQRMRARPLYERALAIYENAFDPEHLNTARVRSSYARLLFPPPGRRRGHWRSPRPTQRSGLTISGPGPRPGSPPTRSPACRARPTGTTARYSKLIVMPSFPSSASAGGPGAGPTSRTQTWLTASHLPPRPRFLSLSKGPDQSAQRPTDVEDRDGLGRHRRVGERALPWLRRFRRLTTRYERRTDIHHVVFRLRSGLPQSICRFVKLP